MSQNVVDADYRARGLDQNKETLLGRLGGSIGGEVPLLCQPRPPSGITALQPMF